MNKNDFLKIDSVIVVEGSENSFHDGAWKILKMTEEDGETRLKLASAHRKNKAFITLDFNADTMRPINEAQDVVYADDFLPIGSTIETTADNGDVETWTVQNLLSGDNLDNARFRLEKDKTKNHFNSKATVQMTTKFKPAEMKITKVAKPKLSRLKM